MAFPAIGPRRAELGTRHQQRTVDRLERRLGARVEALAQASGHTVTIVGWSLGGLYARALARRLPQHVRQVITLGSPFRQQHDRQVRANAVYRALSRWHVADSDLVVLDDADRPLQVPATSVYSRSDGIAHWETCIDVVSATAENVRVRASHFGLPAHPAVLFLVADRLAQPMDEWAPFQPPSALRSLYPTAG